MDTDSACADGGIATGGFVPHSVDPLLSLSAAGRLVGLTHSCIAKWIDNGMLPCVKGQSARRRVRRSDLIRVAGFSVAEKTEFRFVPESELPTNYKYDKATFPLPKVANQITYWPVRAE
jgi:hypothetical protein